MKKTLSRMMSFLLAAMLLLCSLPVVSAAEEIGFSGTVGKEEHFQFYQNYEDIITGAEITEGSVPGLSLKTINNSTAELAGTPTTAGTYTVKAKVTAETAGTLEYVLQVTIEGGKTNTLKVTKQPTDEEVAEGSSVTFIARADNALQYEWELTTVDGGVIKCKNLPDTYPDMEITGHNDEKLVMTKIPLSFDGFRVRCRFINGDESIYSDYAVIKVKAAADLPPTVTKHPTGEIVTEGGRAVFIAKADNVETYDWRLYDSDGTYFTWEDALLQFQELEVTGETTERIVLTKIPIDMDGCTFKCVFKGPGGESESKAAKLEVTPSEDAEPEITKHPTGETVMEGESTAFIAKAKYAKEFIWQLVSPDGTKIVAAADAKSEFPEMKVGGYTTDRLSLENIPLEFSGWKVQCKFVGGGGSVTSEAAIVTVNPDPNKPTETTEPTTEATEEPTTEPTEATEETTEATEEPTEEKKPSLGTSNKDNSSNFGSKLKNILLITLIILGAAVLGGGAAALVVLLRQNRR